HDRAAGRTSTILRAHRLLAQADTLRADAMKRAAIYSSSSRRRAGSPVFQQPTTPQQPDAAVRERVPLRERLRRHPRVLNTSLAAALLVALVAPWLAPRGLTPAQVDGRIEQALQAQAVAPQPADAYAAI